MYACIVKNSENTWDIYGFASYPIDTEKYNNLVAAVESGLPITGMILTPYKWSGTSGATWDGEKFTGGPKSIVPEDIDWNSIQTYGYLCNSIVVYATIANNGSIATQQMNAIFAGDSEIDIIKIPDGQVAKIGDIWDGEKVINT